MPDLQTPVIPSKKGLNFPWLLKMAWRDSRKSRVKLLLFISSIILGIAALVAIYSFGDNLRDDIDNQAASLIGADLAIYSNKPISVKADKLIKNLGKEKSTESSFASMVLFPKNNGTRLIQVKALTGNFPYYGALETEPISAGKDFKNGQEALVDQTLMLQFKASVGDSVKLGKLSFKIAGILKKAPGQTGLSSSVAPVIYIPGKYAEETGLLKKGSRINYNFYYKFSSIVEADKTTESIKKSLEKEELDYETIASKKENTGRSFEDLTGFLSLVGFIALLLGCIGVASSVHIYVKEKLTTVAVLRCLGVSGNQAFIIYLIQIIGTGLLGSIIGAVLGTVVQQVLPLVLKDFLPVDITIAVSWSAILQGIALGVIISFLFALLPLISVRNISPLNTLRLSFEQTSLFKDPLKWVVYGLIVLFVLGFTYLQLGNIIEALSFTAGIITSFLLLSGTAVMMMWLIKKFFPFSWSYIWRQGFSNLYRPNNQTVILIVSIGLGTAFICTLFLIQGMLLQRVNLSASKNQPNMVLFDIQSSQKENIAKLTKQMNLPVIQQVPVVTMRLQEINNINAVMVKKDTALQYNKRLFSREYRVTFRDQLSSSEKIAAGKWQGKVASPDALPEISIEKDYAERNKIKLGDKLLFNVQGALIETKVGSFRTVDWNRIQTNFLVIFPEGVLEEAPQFHVLLTRVPDANQSAIFQQNIVRNFPNVSVIDLGLVLSVLDEILDKIGFVIKFMAGFSIITGIIVLIASVMISKYQRIKESVLLRTIGASRNQILQITALEYFFLGAISALTGLFLSVGASYLLALYSFEVPFNPDFIPVIFIFISITFLTMLIGLFNSRGILNKPPLEILRQEN